jgi:hypothetical protein
MDGECSPSLKMLKEMEIQWMGSAPHRPGNVNPKSSSIDRERSPLPLPMPTKKVVLKMGSTSCVTHLLTRFQHLASFSPRL